MKHSSRGLAATFLAAALLLPCLESSAHAALGSANSTLRSAQASKLDKVLRRNPRTKKVTVNSGLIKTNTLDGVTLEKDGKEQTIKSDEVLRIEWGAVPIAFSEGKGYAAKGDFENAVARFREAAGESSSREVIQAAARLHSAETLLSWGGLDPGQFTNCVSECDRYLSDYPSGRQVPRARWLKARALRLSGDPAGASAIFQGLYGEASTDPPTTGYDRAQSMLAGLDSAESLLAAGQAPAASQLYRTLETSLSTMIAAIEDPTSPERATLIAARGKAAAGEGFVHLAEARLPQALTFFKGRLANKDLPSAERLAATLGLAEVYKAQNEMRLAQVEFAKVAAIDHNDRDRVAQALVGLAESTVKLADADARVLARKYLTDVKNRFGDTPAALRAREILQTL